MTNTFTRLAVRVDTTGASTRIDLGATESTSLAILQDAVDGYVEAVARSSASLPLGRRRGGQ